MKSIIAASLFATSVFLATDASAATFEEIHNAKDLRPETFARHFANFKFVFGADVQSPKDFLAAQAGDCDDYSTFAAAELKARGFNTRLVSVRMKNEAHVVCYVAEANGYLDYNYRARGTGIVPCGPELTEIGDAVAKSFKAKWTSASEFSYDGVVKRLVATTLAQNRPILTASTTSSPGNRAGQ